MSLRLWSECAVPSLLTVVLGLALMGGCSGAPQAEAPPVESKIAPVQKPPTLESVESAVLCADLPAYVGKQLKVTLTTARVELGFGCTRMGCGDAPACSCNSCTAGFVLACGDRSRVRITQADDADPVLRCEVKGCDATCSPGAPQQLVSLTGSLSKGPGGYELKVGRVDVDPNLPAEQMVMEVFHVRAAPR